MTEIDVSVWNPEYRQMTGIDVSVYTTSTAAADDLKKKNSNR